MFKNKIFEMGCICWGSDIILMRQYQTQCLSVVLLNTVLNYAHAWHTWIIHSWFSSVIFCILFCCNIIGERVPIRWKCNLPKDSIADVCKNPNSKTYWFSSIKNFILFILYKSAAYDRENMPTGQGYLYVYTISKMWVLLPVLFLSKISLT